MDLKEYETAKFQLAERLRALETLAGSGRSAIEGDLRKLFSRLAEDRFNLVVVGRFNRGKTSLMNALLGTDRLPTGILPLTSVITTVVYGSAERVIVRFEGSGLDSEVPLSALQDYITQQRNPGNVRRVQVAEVQLPQELLRRGFHFIDTPGLGSHITENTDTTERFLPEADAFLVVTSYESPLSEEELAVLRSASASFRRVILVLNKHDTVNADDRASVLRYVQEQLRKLFGESCPIVFSVSARDGIQAKQDSNDVALEASGIPALEQALMAFLVEEKRAVFLSGMCERITDLAACLPQSDDLVHFFEGMTSLEDKLTSRTISTRSTGAAIVSRASRAPRSEECAICRSVQTATFERLATYQHELATSADDQQQHALHGGFCRLHTRQYASLASPHDLCVGSAPLVEWLSIEFSELAAHLDELDDRKATPLCLSAERDQCPLCLSAAHAEMQAISMLASDVANGGTAEIEKISFICVPHMARVLPALEETGFGRALVEREAALLGRLAEDMRRYAIKHDAIRRYLASQEERDASEMALTALAGLPNGHVRGG